MMFLSRPIRIKDLPSEYELLIANNHFNASDEFSVRSQIEFVCKNEKSIFLETSN